MHSLFTPSRYENDADLIVQISEEDIHRCGKNIKIGKMHGKRN
jgi:hypothetical protein